jgi:hypothetical protein
MNRVAAEGAQEVGMLLENHDVDSRPRQQEAKHDAGWTAASDTAAGLWFLRGRRCRFHP